MFDNIYDYQIVTTSLKFIMLTLAGMFSIYSFIVVRQVSVMKRTLETNYSAFITLLAAMNFLAALGLFGLFVLIL